MSGQSGDAARECENMHPAAFPEPIQLTGKGTCDPTSDHWKVRTVWQSKRQLVYWDELGLGSMNVEVNIPLRTANEVGLCVRGVVALVASSRGGIGFQFKQIVVAARSASCYPRTVTEKDATRGDRFAYSVRKCNESVKLDRAAPSSGNGGGCYGNSVSGPLLAENGDPPLFEQH